MKKINSIAFALLLVLTLVPVLGFAKENENDKDNNRDKNLCVKAFGQFVKNGWRETKGQLVLNENCKIPFGIYKKWVYVSATSTDMVAPVINSFTVNPKSTEANINWTVNEKSRAVVFYGTTTPIVVKSATTTKNNILNSVSSTNSVTVIDNRDLSTNGGLTLKNLSPNTVYYAVLAVRDMSGNVTVSNAITFTTTNSSDVTAPIISNLMTTISLNKLIVSWVTNELTTSKLFYGTSTLNIAATTTPFMSDATLRLNHSFELPLLASTTPYHVILQATDAVGNVQTSVEYSIYSPF